jgi:hypothetical protein
MKIKGALSSAGCLVSLALSVGCAVDAGDSEEAGGTKLKVAQPSTEQFEYAPAGMEFEAAKQTPDDSLSPKGSASRKYGPTYLKALTIPNGGQVGCYTAGGSVGVDPVLALFRRHDNQHKTYPYTEQVWVQSLAINDDTTDRHPYLSFTNTSGSTLNAYLMAFAYGNSTGTVDLWCTGSTMETITIGAGSIHTTVGSGTASTSGSNGDPWLFMIEDTSLSWWSWWNDDISSSNFESSFNYQGGQRGVWFIANGYNSGTTTINY